jgi:hypothetical protein
MWLQRLAHDGWRRAKSPNTRSRTFEIAISDIFTQSSISALFHTAAFQPAKLLRGARKTAMRKLCRSVRSIGQRQVRAGGLCVDTPPPNLLETACARGGLCVRRPVRAAACACGGLCVRRPVRAAACACSGGAGEAKLRVGEAHRRTDRQRAADALRRSRLRDAPEKCCLRPITPVDETRHCAHHQPCPSLS